MAASSSPSAAGRAALPLLLVRWGLVLGLLLTPTRAGFCTNEDANLHLDASGQLVADHAKLQQCPRIKWPMSSNIGVDGARALAEELKINTRTSWIWLYNNGVQEEGAEAIALALKDHDQALRTISLYGNDIRTRGAQAFSKMLTTNHKMQELFLGANSIGDVGAHALADGACVRAFAEEDAALRCRVTHRRRLCHRPT
jgi:hypothetical protein